MTLEGIGIVTDPEFSFYFLRFLLALVRKRRQMLIPEIATEYFNLVDQSEGRIHANVTVARESSESERNAIAEQLSKVLGKQAAK